MPVAILTNAVASSVGSLALLLNPTPEYRPPGTITNATPEAAASETLLGDWGGLRTRWSDRGFNVTVQYIAEVAGNVTGGVDQGAVYNGLLNLAGDVDFDKLAGWRGAKFHAAMLYPHGKSLTDKYVNDLFVLSNLDASDDVHLFELWLEQNLADGIFSVRLGQIALDQEFVYTEQGALFNNSAFGWFPIVGATAPVYPQGAPGVRIKWQAREQIYFQVAVVDGDVNPTDAAGNETNPHGVKFRFDEGALIFAETGFNWALAHDTKPGSLKLGGWYHTADTASVRFDDTGLSLADPLTSGNPATLGDNWGLYLGAEQVLWKEASEDKASAQGVGVFGRLGYAPADRNLLGFYAEAGVTRTGLVPGRDDDVCGVALAYGQIGQDSRGLVTDDNFFNAAGAVVPDYEMVIECEYQWNVRPGFVIQPGMQYIVHPGGSSAIENAFVLSLRTVFDF